MRKLLLSVSLILLTVCTINATVSEKSYDFKDFTGINVSGAFDVELVQSDTFSVTVRTDDRLFEYIDISVHNGILKASFKNFSAQIKRIFNNSDIDLMISMPLLNNIVVTGACDVESDSVFKTDGMTRFSISASGASDVDLNLVAPEIVVSASGASEVKLKGDAGELDVKLSGASSFDSEDLSADNVSVRASGASDADVYVNKRLSVSVSGASRCVYSGNNQIQIDAASVTGASTFKRK